MAITASMVKELRDTTGAGMMDAKKALTETGGDMEAAVDWLRTKGLAKAAKKSGRTAAEGLVAVAIEGGTAVAVEVNSETDFVAKNADFQRMVSDVANAALGVQDVEALKAAKIGSKTVAETITDKVATIGENMAVRRMARVTGPAVVSYVHNAAAPGMGKIGVLVALERTERGVRPSGRDARRRGEPGLAVGSRSRPGHRREGASGPDRHRARERQTRGGDREDDRRTDEEVHGRGDAAEPAVRRESGSFRRRGRHGRRRRDPSPSPGSKSAKGSRRSSRTLPPRWRRQARPNLNRRGRRSSGRCPFDRSWTIGAYKPGQAPKTARLHGLHNSAYGSLMMREVSATSNCDFCLMRRTCRAEGTRGWARDTSN